MTFDMCGCCMLQSSVLNLQSFLIFRRASVQCSVEQTRLQSTQRSLTPQHLLQILLAPSPISKFMKALRLGTPEHKIGRPCPTVMPSFAALASMSFHSGMFKSSADLIRFRKAPRAAAQSASNLESPTACCLERRL